MRKFLASPRLLITVLLLIIVVAQLARIDSTLHRWFNADELEHLHATWCLAQGMVPYRDYFEHHTPLLYAMLAPVLALMKPEASYDAAINAILACRWIMYALGCLILYLTYRLGREMHSRTAGLLAVIFTLSTMMFIDRTTEIRPDMLSVPAMLATLILTTRAFHPNSKFRNSQFFLAGILSALSILATPKTLFFLDGYALAFIVLLYKQNPTWRHRIQQLAIYLVGVAIPFALTLVIFATFNGAAEFVTHNFLLNAHWKFHLDKWEQIHNLAYENPLLVALGTAGLLQALSTPLFNRKSKNGIPKSANPLPALSLLALIFGIKIIPVPYTEYFLMLIPLLAIYQSILLLQTIIYLKRKISLRTLRELTPFILAFIIFIVIIIFITPPFAPSITEKFAWLLTLPTALYLLRKQSRPLALLLLVTMMLLFPIRRFLTLLPATRNETAERSPNNNAQKLALAYIHSKTDPPDPVFDGWHNMSAPFRPHAFHYFFLHREIRPMLPQSTWDQLLSDLTTQKIDPVLVIMDRDNRALPPPIVNHFETHYQPTEIDYIWSRK
jgi:hypothetical protein